jgi:hypothetical protein
VDPAAAVLRVIIIGEVLQLVVLKHQDIRDGLFVDGGA